MDCFFCKIINKDVPSKIIYEDKSVLAILDTYPRVLGHTLILPKIHAENIFDLPDDEIEGVFKAVKKVAKLLEKALAPDGFTIGINHGKVSGQTIEHLHIHIMPRWLDDKGGSIHSVVNNPPKEDLDEIKSLIEKFKSKI
ncbi:HIT family protein [Candidatus Wolfebacteria bacterium]|nr:HIT family protein [Candidatus Wolfebacteria bacterium]